MFNKQIDARFIRDHLCEKGVSFEFIAYEQAPTPTLERMAQKLFIPPQQFARAILLRSGKSYALAVLSVTDHIDFAAIRQVSGIEYEMAWPEDCQSVFPSMPAQYIPPLTSLFEMDCFVDSGLMNHSDIYITDGSDKGVLKLSRSDLWRFQHAPTVLDVAIDPQADRIDSTVAGPDRAQQMRDTILQLQTLPPMPAVAAELLKLSRDPEVRSSHIASVIEQDPAIVAQILRYASSSMYGFRGKIESVERAIFSVLGLNMVTNLALGIAAGKAFRVPAESALSGKTLWRQPVYCAAICEALARQTTSRLGIKPGSAYLSGLLHNIGFMVLAHCLPEQFIELSQQAEATPDARIIDIERELNGITHAEIGAELMHHWALPEQILTVMKYHHDETYSGAYCDESALVLIANRLLLRMGIGDELSTELPPQLLERLGISEKSALVVLENIMANCEEHDALVAKLAA